MQIKEKRNVFYFPNNLSIDKILNNVKKHYNISTTSKLMIKLLYNEAKRLGYRVTNINIDFTSDIIKKSIKNKGDCFIGYNDSGLEEVINLKKIDNLLLVGMSGTGKTTIIKNIINSLLYNTKGNIDIIIFNRFGNYGEYNDYLNIKDINVIDSEKFIYELKQILDNLLKGVMHDSNEDKIIIIEDDILSQKSQDVNKILEHISSVGRGSGYHIILPIQNEKEINLDLTNKFSTQIHFDDKFNFYIN